MSRIFITGVASGLGRIVLGECLRDGHEVLGVVRRAEQREPLLAECGEGLRLEVADLSIEQEVSGLLQALEGERFDHVLLNAGCADVGAFAELPEESIATVLQTNLLANMRLLRALIPGAPAAGTKFVLVSSVVARLPGIRFASYAVSKAGVTQLYKSLAVEYPGIDFLCIELGGVATPFHAKAGYEDSRRRKSAEVIGKRMYEAMLSRTGMCTLSADWWLVRRILMTFEGSVVRLLRWNLGRRA